MRVEAWLFDDCADSRERVAATLGLREAEQRHVAGRRLRQAEQRPEQRGLAGAVRAEEAERDAGGNDEVDAVDRDATAEALGYGVGFDDIVHAIEGRGGRRLAHRPQDRTRRPP